jgi:hypothetical protein
LLAGINVPAGTFLGQDDAMGSITYRPVTLEQAGELLTLQRAAFVAEARTYSTVDIPPLAE